MLYKFKAMNSLFKEENTEIKAMVEVDSLTAEDVVNICINGFNSDDIFAYKEIDNFLRIMHKLKNINWYHGSLNALLNKKKMKLSRGLLQAQLIAINHRVLRIIISEHENKKNNNENSARDFIILFFSIVCNQINNDNPDNDVELLLSSLDFSILRLFFKQQQLNHIPLKIFFDLFHEMLLPCLLNKLNQNIYTDINIHIIKIILNIYIYLKHDILDEGFSLFLNNFTQVLFNNLLTSYDIYFDNSLKENLKIFLQKNTGNNKNNLTLLFFIYLIYTCDKTIKLVGEYSSFKTNIISIIYEISSHYLLKNKEDIIFDENLFEIFIYYLFVLLNNPYKDNIFLEISLDNLQTLFILIKPTFQKINIRFNKKLILNMINVFFNSISNIQSLLFNFILNLSIFQKFDKNLLQLKNISDISDHYELVKKIENQKNNIFMKSCYNFIFHEDVIIDQSILIDEIKSLILNNNNENIKNLISQHNKKLNHFYKTLKEDSYKRIKFTQKEQEIENQIEIEQNEIEYNDNIKEFY